MSTPPEQFLKSVGFDFESSCTYPAYPPGFEYDKLLNRHHRIECRKQIPSDKYGDIFEGIVFELLYKNFEYDLLRKVKIKDEGSGGDYDIIAFSSPYLLYVECKTSSNISFQNILNRHSFLCPGLTLILIDQPKVIVKEIINKEVQPALTQKAISEDMTLKQNPDFQYPIKIISDEKEAIILFHTHRNIFIASGEDLEKVIKRTLRYFHQVVQQTSYWG